MQGILIRQKTAVREYSPTKVPTEIIREIVDAGRLAQSSRNSQPWRFLVVSKMEDLQALSRLGKFAAHLANASFGIAILIQNPANNVSILFDAGQAASYMQLAALEFGVGSCIVKLHEGSKAGSILGFPDDWQLDFMIGFGYPLEPISEIQRSKRARLTIDQVAYLDRWGVGFPEEEKVQNRIEQTA